MIIICEAIKMKIPFHFILNFETLKITKIIIVELESFIQDIYVSLTE